MEKTNDIHVTFMIESEEKAQEVYPHSYKEAMYHIDAMRKINAYLKD